MLAIAFDFPAGRYHATPWGRHVNEADVGWPPDPWRLARALLATWHRKVTPDEVPRETLARLIEALAGELSGHALPSAVHAHTRHHMPTRDGRAEKTTLVFDAFARFGADARLVAVWSELHLHPDDERTLDLLLARLSYLGRAESWVEARRLPEWSGTIDARPAGDGSAASADEPHDLVTLLFPARPPTTPRCAPGAWPTPRSGGPPRRRWTRSWRPCRSTGSRASRWRAAPCGPPGSRSAPVPAD